MNKEISLDIQEVNLDNIDNTTTKKEISINNDELNNSNFGSGIELLMNEKVKNNTSRSSSTNNLKDLENEINNLESVSFNEKEININSTSKPTIEIAKATTIDKTETWDGFQDINSININEIEDKSKKLSNEELLKEKFEILRKLETLETKGATLSKKYTMESDLNEMQGEYEFLINEKEKQNSVKFQGKVLTTLITGLEFLNNKFDPFDIKLDGWSEQINENVEDFDEIFSELHEKYKSKAKMAPEIKLLFQLASSGIMIHMTNTMFKSALPGMDDIMKQNPDLMNHFTKAAMNSMEQSTPGLNNFVNDFGMSHSNQSNNVRSSQPESFNEENKKNDMRKEMKGPGNIDSLLSNLNNKTNSITLDKDSTISIEDVDNLSVSSFGSNKRKGKKKENKNSIKLAI